MTSPSLVVHILVGAVIVAAVVSSLKEQRPGEDPGRCVWLGFRNAA